jgi:hypothetical protein
MSNVVVPPWRRRTKLTVDGNKLGPFFRAQIVKVRTLNHDIVDQRPVDIQNRHRLLLLGWWLRG